MDRRWIDSGKAYYERWTDTCKRGLKLGIAESSPTPKETRATR